MATASDVKAVRVFYSWQSDLPASTNFNAIRGGLDKAFKKFSRANADSS